jgi:hypothetical protein
LAKKYYEKLFREYCISDLSRYKENKVCGLAIMTDSGFESQKVVEEDE